MSSFSCAALRNACFTFAMICLLIPSGVAGQNSVDLKTLKEACIRFDNQFNGLRFETKRFAKGKIFGHDIWRVSEDGRVAISGGGNGWRPANSKYKNTGAIGLRTLNKGYDFSINYDLEGEKKNRVRGMVVTFLKPDFYGVAQLAFLLGPHGYDIERYIDESETTISQVKRKGQTYWELRCVHPKLVDKSFLFDDELKIVWIERFFNIATDKIVTGERYATPFKIPPGVTLPERVKNVSGPIQYTTFGDRVVVSSYTEEIEESYRGNKVVRGPLLKYTFTGYEPAGEVNDRIEFEGITFPSEPIERRVSSQGEPAVRYEVRDGELVKVLDSHALKTARAARLRSGGIMSSVYWHAFLGLVAILAVFFLIWKRNQE